MGRISVDFSKKVNRIKPLHGIGNAPILGAGDESMFHYLGEAGIPYSRLHDTGGAYGNYIYVDIENIFRNFDADVNDPESYDFTFTDWLLSALEKQGVRPFYRLGATIENAQHIKAYRIYPPKDYDKWAEICAHIIRHYNEGWADGFHYDIEYWEIWNEPDNYPDIKDNCMWKGTMEDYFHLYEITSRKLKGYFPHLKIGGYASCGFYAITETNCSDTAKSSPRTEYFVTFFHEFMKYISSEKHRSPLDFFSWHSYAPCKETITHAKYCREQLDSYGFYDTESIFNEWNPGTWRRGNANDAAYIAEMMINLQDAPVDKAMYYDGAVKTSYGGLFDPLRYTAFKALDSFVYFDFLYKLGMQVKVENETGMAVMAASNGEKHAIYIANTGEVSQVELDLTGIGEDDMVLTSTLTDSENHRAKSEVGKIFSVPKESIMLIEL